ncbi:hypothetical protein FRC14_006676 [Serendipita sp. 396]|nr:hypothetical protein FRC14_006676 [Serendipita sp. 396]
MPLANQTGTYWYHSLTNHFQDPEDPNLDQYDVDDESTVITLADWFHTESPELLTAYMATTNTASNDALPQSGTINGVGRTSTDTQPARPVFTVTSGMRYRFRIINASALARFNFQISGHTLTVIEADGENHVPLTVDRLLLQPGQRYSVVVEANQAVDNYWIRAPMAARTPNPAPTNWATDSDNVNAVLHYVGAADAEPTTTPPALSGTVLNEALLVPSTNPAAPGTAVAGGADKVFNLAFATVTDSTSHHWTVNGVQYISPTVPTLLQILSGATDASDFATNENTFIINKGDVVEINITGVPNHPFHLHGHSFSVVKGATGSTNYVNPPRRDVTPSATGGITIRFTADNPGPWILHCHIDLHLDAGLAVVFAEAPEDVAAGADSVDPDDSWDDLCPIYNALAAEDQ